jgi:HAD superfamily hydrolase (TIGR01509 family)
MRPKAVLFDCDGVIVDSEGIAFDLIGAELSAHGLDLDQNQMASLFLGGTMRGVYVTALERGADLPPNWVAGFYEKLYARLAQGTPLIAGVEAVLDRLDAAGIRYAIGSNGAMRKMEVTLGQHPDLHRRFQGRMFSGQDLGNPKPAPDLYLHAAAALGMAAGDCVVVEDSPTGARAARAAGMRCLGYAPLGNAALAAEGAEVFGDMADLPGLIGL